MGGGERMAQEITVEGFKADGNTAAIETLVLAHEGVNIPKK